MPIYIIVNNQINQQINILIQLFGFLELFFAALKRPGIYESSRHVNRHLFWFFSRRFFEF